MKKENSKKLSLEDYISQLMYDKLGFRKEVNGSLYLQFYLYNAINDNVLIFQYSPTKEIYPSIAEKFDVTPTKVEKSIRNEIEIVWKYMNENIRSEIFLFNFQKRPTNLEFICTIYDYIKRNYKLNSIEEKVNGHKVEDKKFENDEVLNNYIYELIYDKLQVKHKLKGGTYLFFYIKNIFLNNLEIYNYSPTKEIYPFIASEFKTTPSIVERAIRNVVEASWQDMDESVKNEIFPIINDHRPTNMEFIYCIYEYIKNNAGKNYNSELRFKIQRTLEDTYKIYSHFGFIKLQILIDSIMMAIQMNGVSDKEMNYIIFKISEKYGLDIGTYELHDGYTHVDTITPLLYKMCKQIYNNNQDEFPNPIDKKYIKNYLNILTKQIKEDI